MTTTTADRTTDQDVVVVGGGAAGLSAGLMLARAGRRVVVVDDGAPRNAPATSVHGLLGHEGTSPAQLLATGRVEVTAHGGAVVTGRVVSAGAITAPGGEEAGPAHGDAESADSGFVVDLADGARLTARRLVVTTGLSDELPDVPGVAERWGRDVLHCPYCHGHEVRGQSIGVLATGPMAVHHALLWRQWSDRVTLLRHRSPEPTDEQWEQLAARDVAVVDGEVTGLVVVDDHLAGARLAGGRVVPMTALVVATRMVARSDLLAGLGLELAELRIGDHVVGRYVPADPTGATTVPGVWVAGNVTDLHAQVGAAAAGGARAAAGVNADLVAADVRAAVAHRRRAGAVRADS